MTTLKDSQLVLLQDIIPHNGGDLQKAPRYITRSKIRIFFAEKRKNINLFIIYSSNKDVFSLFNSHNFIYN